MSRALTTPALRVDRSELLEVIALLDQAKQLRDVGEIRAQHVEHQAREHLALIVDSAELVWEISNE